MIPAKSLKAEQQTKEPKIESWKKTRKETARTIWAVKKLTDWRIAWQISAFYMKLFPPPVFVKNAFAHSFVSFCFVFFLFCADECIIKLTVKLCNFSLFRPPVTKKG